MTRTTAECLLLAALAAAAWLVLDGGRRAPDVADAAGRLPAWQVDPVGGGLSERVSRLRANLAAPAPPDRVRRNPFSFTSATKAAARQRAHSTSATDEAAATRPQMVLSGIAEDGYNGAAVRTAVISVAGQLVFAKEGDRVLSRFEVLRIGADAVQLKDAVSGDIFTLSFR